MHRASGFKRHTLFAVGEVLPDVQLIRSYRTVHLGHNLE